MGGQSVDDGSSADSWGGGKGEHKLLTFSYIGSVLCKGLVMEFTLHKVVADICIQLLLPIFKAYSI